MPNNLADGGNAPPAHSPSFLFPYAAFTVFSTILLLAAGALVTSTGSSLSVPDWPLSFGQLMPPMIGGVLYEHGHRMIAGVVGILTLLLAGLLWRYETRAWVKWLGTAALIGVVAQALLGGLTVLLRLPAFVSVAHACLAQLFFCSLIVLAWTQSESWATSRPTRIAPNGVLFFGFGLASLFFAQLFVGAWMRHLGAGASIPDFPLSLGQWIPPMENLLVRVHFLHRVGAYLLVMGVALLTLILYRSRRASGEWVFLSGLLFTFVLVQGVLGAVTIWTGRPVALTTLHLVTGALCLATVVMLCVSFCRGSQRTL